MKKSALVLASLTAMMASLAAAQTIPAPAGSTDSGGRGVVAITPVDTSNLATKTEVNNAYNSAVNYSGSLYNASINHTEYRYNMAVTHANAVSGNVRPWTLSFPGGYRRALCGGSGGYLDVYIDSAGRAYTPGTYGGVSYLGGTGYLTMPLQWSAAHGLGGATYVVAPTSFDQQGNPLNWTATCQAYYTPP